jgi:maleylacetoacetate isomerase
MKADGEPRLALYTYWRSSAAYRVRIALHLKELPYEPIPVHLVRGGGEQRGANYLSVNPQGLVPTLLHGDVVLTQSLAICEYLDECFPRYPLLPEEASERALVRSLALQIACEIHPLNNLRVQQYLQQEGDMDALAWMMHWMHTGFTALEKQLAAGVYSRRHEPPGLFECFLVPQVYNAERYGLDMAPFPEISRIVGDCKLLPAFQLAAPEAQPDAEPA